jgi:hypothetical protein
MRASDCGVLFSSWFLLIRGLNLARRQAETPLIALCKNPGPLLTIAPIPCALSRSQI